MVVFIFFLKIDIKFIRYLYTYLGFLNNSVLLSV